MVWPLKIFHLFISPPFSALVRWSESTGRWSGMANRAEIGDRANKQYLPLTIPLTISTSYNTSHNIYLWLYPCNIHLLQYFSQYYNTSHNIYLLLYPCNIHLLQHFSQYPPLTILSNKHILTSSNNPQYIQLWVEQYVKLEQYFMLQKSKSFWSCENASSLKLQSFRVKKQVSDGYNGRNWWFTCNKAGNNDDGCDDDDKVIIDALVMIMLFVIMMMMAMAMIYLLTYPLVFCCALWNGQIVSV